jgi:hypothetical protein
VSGDVLGEGLGRQDHHQAAAFVPEECRCHG